MSPAVAGVSAHEAMDSADNQGAVRSESHMYATASGFKQALTSLNLAPTDLWSGRISIQENATLDDQEPTMIIKEDFYYIVREYTARAAMARSSDAGPTVTQIKDKSVVVMDCGASRTVTGSLLNTREVIEKTINIETADGKQSMKSSHTCLKTYFLRNRTGEVKPITVQAIYVMEFPQDLLQVVRRDYVKRIRKRPSHFRVPLISSCSNILCSIIELL